MKFLKLFGIALLFFIPFSTQAQPAAASGPEQVIREGVGKLAVFLQTTNPDNARQIQAYLDTEIAPYFDFGYMAKWVAGPTRRYMNAGQFAQFEQGLQRVFLRAMAANLHGAYSGQKIDFQQSRRGSRANEAVVSIRIIEPNRRPLRMDFRLYQGDGSWKVFDVMANGSSAVTYYRKHYARLIRRYGVQSVLGGM